jgi:hypothetical protein
MINRQTDDYKDWIDREIHKHKTGREISGAAISTGAVINDHSPGLQTVKSSDGIPYQ